MKILDKTTQTYKELVLRPGGDTLPIGSIVAFSGENIPNGWLLCDGSVVSRTTYSELFNAIGLNYVEDGVEWLDEERFPLPNAKGRTLVGKDSTDTDFNTLGKTAGEKTHTLTVNEMASHTHDVAIAVNNTVPGGARYFFNSAGTTSAPISDTAAWSNSLTAKATGGGQAHNNLQPSLTLNYIIKAKNIVVVKGEVIQENGTANENNTYSAKAIDNKLKTNIVIGQEFETGRVIDGKKEFGKKISIGSLPNAARKIVETGLTDVKVTKLYGMARDSTLQIPLPFVYPELPSCIGLMYVNGNIYINTGSDRTGLTGEITIYYTKNT
nr:MAG TPA: tail collar domain [Caudoviricetes sp.]